MRLALLIGTGLLLRSFDQLRRVDPGFQPDRVVTMRLRLPDARYRDRQQVLTVLEGVLARVSALPGIESAALTTGVPLGRAGLERFAAPGLEGSTPDRLPLAQTQWVSEGYHRTFGIPLRAGRYFTAADRAGSADVVIVDEWFARTHFPGTNPAAALGQRVTLADRGREIVGVVSHITHRLEEPPIAQIYGPFEQMAPGRQMDFGRAMDLAVKSATEPDAIVAAVRKEMQAIDREAPLSHITSMTGALERAMAPRIFNLVLLALFAGAALLLCVVGLYGVISYSVAQRTSEIGVRLTLGAQRSDVLRLVLTEGLRMAAAGVAVGVLAALLLGRLVEGLLFGVRPADPVTYAAVVLLLIVVAALASFIPTRRATTMDLVSALRGN